MPAPSAPSSRQVPPLRLSFEADPESDALLRVLAFALTLSLSPRRVLAERSGAWLKVELSFDRSAERSARLLLSKTEAVISARRVRITGCSRD